MVERFGLRNVHSVFANLSVDLPRLFPPASVARFHLNFPDPYWKKCQHKRRVVSPGLMTDLHDRLVPGGEVHVASDVFDIALEAMAELESADGFTSLPGPWTFLRASSFGARSPGSSVAGAARAPARWRPMTRTPRRWASRQRGSRHGIGPSSAQSSLNAPGP